jgi:hypothetical protein
VAFTINDFQDLVQLLEENPRWRNELRRLIVADDFAEISKSIRELIELSKQHEARLTHIEKDIVELKTDVAVLKTDVAVLKTDVAVLKTDVAVLKTDVAVLKTDVASLKGNELERSFRERPYVYLSRFARRLRIVTDAELAAIIEDALDNDRLTEQEADDLRRIDAIAKGKHKTSGSDLYLAVEASSVFDEHDLDRALRRAELLAKATGVPAQAIIAGDVPAKGIVQLAESRGVYWVSRG